MMYMDLVSHTPIPECVAASAVRLCYLSARHRDNLGDMTKQQVNKFVTDLVKIEHESLLEHVTFTFIVDDVSRVLSHQLVRHRIASYSQRSQRYVGEKGFGFVIPESISANPAVLKIYKNTMA